MKLKFKPENFIGLGSWQHDLFAYAAASANAKLDEWRKSWVKVHSNDYYKSDKTIWFFKNHESGQDTHQAWLVEIESTEKKECEHVPVTICWDYGTSKEISSTCDKCGVKLKATWSAE